MRCLYVLGLVLLDVFFSDNLNLTLLNCLEEILIRQGFKIFYICNVITGETTALCVCGLTGSCLFY